MGVRRSHDGLEGVIVLAFEPHDTACGIKGIERPVQTCIDTQFVWENPRGLRIQGHKPGPDVNPALPLEPLRQPRVDISEEILDVGAQSDQPLTQSRGRAPQGHRMESAVHEGLRFEAQESPVLVPDLYALPAARGIRAADEQGLSGRDDVKVRRSPGKKSPLGRNISGAWRG